MDLGHDAVYPEAVVNGLLSIDRVGCDKVLECMKSHIQKTGDDRLPLMTTIQRSNIQIMCSKQKTTTNSELKLTSAKEEKDISIVLMNFGSILEQVEAISSSLYMT